MPKGKGYGATKKSGTKKMTHGGGTQGKSTTNMNNGKSSK